MCQAGSVLFVSKPCSLSIYLWNNIQIQSQIQDICNIKGPQLILSVSCQNLLFQNRSVSFSFCSDKLPIKILFSLWLWNLLQLPFLSRIIPLLQYLPHGFGGFWLYHVSFYATLHVLLGTQRFNKWKLL